MRRIFAPLPAAAALAVLLAVAIWSYPRWLPAGFEVNLPLPRPAAAASVQQAVREGRIRVPEGFQVGFYAQVRGARMLRATARGDLLVSSPGSGEIVLLEADEDGSGEPDGAQVLLRGLRRPHGIDLHEGWLYVAETHAFGRIRYDPATRELSGTYQRLREDLPPGGNHWTRTLRFGPDGMLYVSVGSTCNVCIEDDPRRAAILRFQPDGSAPQIFASGLRNAVGFDWDPVSGDLLATENGRDHLGDDLPPCELNRVVEGGFYGWPFVNGDGRLDPDFGSRDDPRKKEARGPAHSFRAHNAPLGLAFADAGWPSPWAGAPLVALHGSWNRSRKDGYKVVALIAQQSGKRHETGDRSDARAQGFVERDFVWGFLEDGDVVGRPVDVARANDGSVFVSDDYADAIYRITPTPSRPTVRP
jgi:glucose/arabinose dehydrogenase